MARFPIEVGERVVETPAQLGALARDDARTGGGVIPGARVAQWLAALVAGGDLDPTSATGLCAALIRHADAATIAEGARLASILGDRALGPLILRALEAHDTGLLLEPDPADPTRSVEDALLLAASAVADLSDGRIRERVLVRLRNSALRVEEARILATWGTPEELTAWIPAVLVEGFPQEARAALEARLSSGDEAATALALLLGASAANAR